MFSKRQQNKNLKIFQMLTFEGGTLVSAGAECSAANIGALPREQTTQASRWRSCLGAVVLRTPRGRTGSLSGLALRDPEIAEDRKRAYFRHARFRSWFGLPRRFRYLRELGSGILGLWERLRWFRLVSVDFLRCTFFILASC